MTRQTPTRTQVISAEVALRLADYLGFRHFYRHSYSFALDWSELEDLVTAVQEVWSRK